MTAPSMTAKELHAHTQNQALWSLIQRGLKATGHYSAHTFLGVPGPETFKALDAYLRQDGGSALQFADRLCQLAVNEVGTKEYPSNSGERITQYQRATWLEGTGWPYCAAFICWLVREAAARDPKIEIPFERPRTAGAWDFERWAREQKARGVQLLTSGPIRAGDIVVFRISHIGLAVADETGGRVQTVEGNTGPEGGREGDGVWRKNRKKAEFRSWIRFAF